MDNNSEHLITEVEWHEIYKTVWENSPDALILVDSKGFVLQYIKAVNTIFGMPSEDVHTNKSLFRYLKTEDRSRARDDFMYALQNGELKDCEYKALRGNDFYFPINVSYRRLNFSR